MESESERDRFYLVDLLEYHRNGQCDCHNFRIEIQPVWEEGKVPPRKHCKHIRRCRRHLAHKIMCACRLKVNRQLTDQAQDQAVNRLLRVLWRFERDSRENPLRFGCGEGPRTPKPTKWLPAKSKKRIAEDEKYFALVAQFKIDHPFCEVCRLRDRTPRPTQDPHHRFGKVGNLRMAVETWAAACRDCHNFVHDNIEWARSVGLIAEKGKWNSKI